MGVCAYEGSAIYPEQFEPDVVCEIKEVKKEDNKSNKEEKYKKDNKGRFYKQVDFDDYENKLEKRNNEDVLYYKITGFLERLRGVEIFEGEEAFNALLEI